MFARILAMFVLLVGIIISILSENYTVVSGSNEKQ
jgi:hypothetical protein